MSPQVIKWPLLSRRNLAISGAVVLLLLFVIGKVMAPAKAITQASNHAITQASTPVDAPTDAPIWTPVPSQAPTAEPTKDPHTSMNDTAVAFATAWASPQLSQAEWLAGVNPWVTPKLALSLATTDPARVPATKLTGPARLEKYGPGWAWTWVEVPTDGGNIMLSMVSKPDPACEVCETWLVSNVAPADQPTAAPTTKGAK